MYMVNTGSTIQYASASKYTDSIVIENVSGPLHESLLEHLIKYGYVESNDRTESQTCQEEKDHIRER